MRNVRNRFIDHIVFSLFFFNRLSKSVLLSCEKLSTQKGKNLHLLGANPFILV